MKRALTTCFIALVASSIALTMAATHTMAESMSLSADRDAMLMVTTYSSGFADENFGHGTRLQVGVAGGSGTEHEVRSLIAFDVSPLSGQSVSITGITLRLFLTDGDIEGETPFTVEVHEVSAANADWPEGTGAVEADEPDDGATWNNKDENDVGTATPWAGSVGLHTSVTDYDTTLLASSTHNSLPVSNSAVDFVFTGTSTELTDLIAGWETTNPGLLLFHEDPASLLVQNKRMIFHSREEDVSGMGAYAPQLIVTYRLLGAETLAATNVTAMSACLNGYLSSTGTSSTMAFVYWGETDGETNATQWANTNTFAAPQSIGPLTTNVTLQTGKEYFYRYAASNDSGRVWADSSEYLLTAGITVSANPDAISENGDTATFSFTREQSVASAAVTVYYEIGGDAVNGTDYESLTETNVVIAAGDTNATVQVTSILDYHFNSDEELELSVFWGGNYAVGTPSNAVLTITNEVLPDLTIDSAINGYWDAGTTWVGGSVPTPADHVTITNGCTVTIRNNTTSIVQSLTIETNAVLTHSANSTTVLGERYKVILDIANDLTIDLGGQINVDGKGYGARYGLGAPSSSAAGSYGGRGGREGSSYSGPTYGSITAPTNFGSGGRDTSGGGAVQLTVAGSTIINGVITSGGGEGVYHLGSGGSVFLTTGALTGNGTIRANGASWNSSGGGGRVAVLLTDSTDFGSVRLQAYGGSRSSKGAAGTVYMQTASQNSGQGTLLIDANNIVTADPSFNTTIGSLVSDSVVGSVIITNQAILAVNNQTLTVQGDLDNKATVTGMLDGTVVFGGTNAASIKGNNTYYNLVCTNADKALAFEDGKTNTVNGILTLANASLDSISQSASWFLNTAVGQHSVSNVTVGRSDARPGVPIEAYDSTDQGGNFNWVFAESGLATNTWTGTTDSDWSKTNNWSKGRPTIYTDAAIIPDSCPNYPLLDADKRLLSLSISNGAAMSLNGFNLTVDANTKVAGTLTATGPETLTLGGDLDFSGGGSFNAASSMVWIVGSNAQSVVSSGNAFYGVTISNSAAPVAFADAVVASNIVNMATPVAFAGSVTVASAFRTQGTNVSFGGALTVPTFDNQNGALVFSGTVTTVAFTNWQGDLTFEDNVSTRDFYCAPGAMALTFNAGKTVTVGNLELYGSVGYPIQLRSSAASHWLLNVTNQSTVRLVDVQYSDALGGVTIYPLASTDGGDNLNWDFGGTWQTWVGGVSAVFTNANNWTPTGDPATSMHLLIDGYYTTPPILSGTATVEHLIVGGGVATATLTVNGQLTTLGDVDVLSMGTITHSANSTDALGERYKLNLSVSSNLTISTGGQINVDGKGYAARNGPGTRIGDSAAGSYGGRGGRESISSYSGPTYGSITAPTNLGSGGRDTSGGGAVQLIVAGTSTVNGVITAGGANMQYHVGSGGSVSLTTGALTGNGTIRANGASWNSSGGGGRVAVILTNSTEFGAVQLQAYGGNGHSKGAAGTVYMQTASQNPGQGTLLIDDNNIITADPSFNTTIGSLVTDTEVGTVVIANQAILELSTNQSLTVNGSWSNAATFIAVTNSTVNLASAAPTTVSGNNAFYNLTAGAAGKTIRFEAGKTNTVNGKLTFRDGTTLLSTADGDYTYLVLSSGGTQEVGRVTVKDNHAGMNGGQEILAGAGSQDLKHNENWFFPPNGTLLMIR